jgi:hypothetical protein
MDRRVVLVWGLTLAIAGPLAGGCAGREAATATPLPPAKTLQAGDFARLAGEWEGTIRGVGTTGHLVNRTAHLRVNVKPDGSWTSTIDGAPQGGRGRIEGGKLILEGSAARGTATLHEGGGRSVLVGQGTWVGVEGDVAFEVTKR